MNMFYQNSSYFKHIKILVFSWENIALGMCDNVEMAEKKAFYYFPFFSRMVYF